ncbi:VirB11-like NTPase and helix-turn-helix domain-containing protein [Candidatus Hepatincolaceae symbiont of Richtersius coronifer]
MLRRGGIKEFVEDPNLTESFIGNLMSFACGIAPTKRISSKGKQVSVLLPLNKFRFTGEIGKEMVESGVKISIRLTHGLYTYKDFGMSQLEFNFLIKYICEKNSSVFVVGGPSSGKTSFNNMIIYEIDQNTVIKVVGNVNEFVFKEGQKVNQLIASSSEEYQRKFDTLTRLNPERVFIPELDTKNIDFILRCLNMGLAGLVLTMHANDKEFDIAKAFEQNLRLAGLPSSNLKSIHEQIIEKVDFFIFLQKDSGGKRKISRVAINNSKILEEAKELGIFGFGNKEKIGKKQNKLVYKENSMTKIAKDYAKGLPVNEIAKKYGISRDSIYRTIKIFRDL